MTHSVKGPSPAARGVAFAALALATCLPIAAHAKKPATQTKQQRLTQLAVQKRVGADRMAKKRTDDRRMGQINAEKRAGAAKMAAKRRATKHK